MEVLYMTRTFGSELLERTEVQAKNWSSHYKHSQPHQTSSNVFLSAHTGSLSAGRPKVELLNLNF